MFEGCKSLTTAPNLNAETVPDTCYYWMFKGCTSLKTAPNLPAKTLGKCSYMYMFAGCTSLTTAPNISATTLAQDCYKNMFYKCTKLKVVENYSKLTSSKIVEFSTTSTPSTQALYMFLNTGGVFTGTPAAGKTYYYYNWAITFNSQSGSSVSSQYTLDNGIATKPSDPTREGFIFCGWYTGSACSAANKFDFSTKITKDTTLYAKWLKEPQTTDLIFTPPTSLVYDGTAKVASFTADTGMGTITAKYATSPSSPNWSATAPTDAGTYYVMASIAEGSKYTAKDLTSSDWKFIVAKADPTVTAPKAKTPTYSGTAQVLVEDATTTGGTLNYAVTNDATEPTTGWAATLPQATNAGTYYVWYKVIGDDNYNDVAAKNITASIAKETPTVTVPKAKTSLIYNTSAQDLLDSPATTTGGTINYAVTNDATAPTTGWATTLPQATNAGTYYVWYKVDGGINYEDVDPANIPVSIAKADATVTAPTAKTPSYSGTAQVLVEAATTTGGTLYYAVTNDATEPTTGWATTLPQATNAGTYYVWYKVDGGINYEDVDSANISVSIAKADPTLTVSPESSDYTMTTSGTFTYLYDGDGDISVLSDNINIATATVDNTSKTVTVTPVTAGTAHITVSAAEGVNYNEISTKHTATITSIPTSEQTMSTGSQTGDFTGIIIMVISIALVSAASICLLIRKTS